jgi:glycine/D-amino acid oxidase-like deaminating enzyme/nitrite reductase/ring-hydroxylating ferredoxin subunit
MKNENLASHLSLLDRDGTNLSPWQESVSTNLTPEGHPPASVYDAIIIGGGITGMTTALLLQLQNKKCVLIESKNIGFGTTGGTTAHINTFFDTTYPEIESDFGKDGAKLAAQSAKEAVALVAELVERFRIDCDFEYKDGLMYSESEEESKLLEEILAASKRAGVAVDYAGSNQIPVAFDKVISFSKQAQFHPVKYLNALADEFKKAGGTILENHFVIKTGHEDDLHVAEGENFIVRGRNLIHATHLPHGINLFNFTCAPYRSYVIGVSLADDAYPNELIYDMQEPYHYFRTHTINGKKILIIGGEDHKTGHDEPDDAFDQLIAYTRAHFNVASVDYQWSSQYYVPADGLAYIGHYPGAGEGCYVATGYNGNGMIFGTLAAKMISNEILGLESPYSSLYKPSRIKPIAGFTEFVKENADVAWRFVADRFAAEDITSLNEIEKDSGCLVDYEGKQIAVYKNEEGKVHALNPTCTHAGCIVKWNQTEKSWDCPCHGGRYDVNGKVITGPPTKDLQKLDIS